MSNTIATTQLFKRGVDAMLNSQAKLDKTQQQLSTGKRVNTASDDPLAAAQAERTRADLARMTAAQRAIDTSKHAMSQADTALATGVDLLQTARETMVAAGNAAYGDSERASLSQQLKAIRDQLLTVANRDDGSGGYLFGGQASSATPFTNTPAGVIYGGIAGDRTVGLDVPALNSLDGNAVWMTMPQGNGTFATASNAANTGAAWIDAGEVTNANAVSVDSFRIDFAGAAPAFTYNVTDTTTGTVISTGSPYTSGGAIDIGGQRVHITGTPAAGDRFTVTPAQPQSVFDTLDRAIALLATPGVGNTARLSEQLAGLTAGLDGAEDRLQLARTRVGEQLRTLDGNTDALAARGIDGEARLSEYQDLDFARAISDFRLQQNSVQAAMQTYSQVAGLSLFNFIK